MLLLPVVFANSDFEPIAVLPIACEAFAPTPLLNKAISPMATSLLCVVLFLSAFTPIAILEFPVVFE